MQYKIMNLKFFNFSTTFLLFLLLSFPTEAQEREKIDGENRERNMKENREKKMEDENKVQVFKVKGFHCLTCQIITEQPDVCSQMCSQMHSQL